MQVSSSSLSFFIPLRLKKRIEEYFKTDIRLTPKIVHKRTLEEIVVTATFCQQRKGGSSTAATKLGKLAMTELW